MKLFRWSSGLLLGREHYEVGDIFLTMNNKNPGERFKGTWELIAKGRTLVGVDTTQTEFNSVRKTGGAKTHTLTVGQMPEHAHTFKSIPNTDTQPWVAPNQVFEYKYVSGTHYNFLTTSSGSTQAHNNLQPYLTTYIWERVS